MKCFEQRMIQNGKFLFWRIMGYDDYFVQKQRHEIRVLGLSSIHTDMKAL
jgi:hypothetical protein